MTQPSGPHSGYREREPFQEQVESVVDDDEVVSAQAILSLMPQGEPETIESLAGDLRTYGDTVSEAE